MVWWRVTFAMRRARRAWRAVMTMRHRALVLSMWWTTTSATLSSPWVGDAEWPAGPGAPCPGIILLGGLTRIVVIVVVVIVVVVLTAVASSEGVIPLALEGGNKVPERRRLVGVP